MFPTTTTEPVNFIKLYPAEVEKKAKRIRALISGPPKFLKELAMLPVVWYGIWEVGKLAEKMRTRLSEIEVENQDKRNSLQILASEIAELSEMFVDAHDALVEQKGPLVVFRPKLLRRLDDLSCEFEDMAETAALGASEAFANAVRERVEPALRHAQD